MQRSPFRYAWMMAGNPRRANGTQRNAVTARVKREESHCWLCKRPVDKTLPYIMPGAHTARCGGRGGDCAGCLPHPWRGVVDEIIPVSRGGSPFDRANCRLAHWICNNKRGNRPAGEKRKPATPEPLVTSRRW